MYKRLFNINQKIAVMFSLEYSKYYIMFSTALLLNYCKYSQIFSNVCLAVDLSPVLVQKLHGVNAPYSFPHAVYLKGEGRRVGMKDLDERKTPDTKPQLSPLMWQIAVLLTSSWGTRGPCHCCLAFLPRCLNGGGGKRNTDRSPRF